MYCLDTNVIIDFLKNNKKIIDKISNISRENLFITPINLCELLKGADNSEKLKYFLEITDSLNFLEFNKEVCKSFGFLYLKLKKEGKMIPEADLMIASFVKSYNLILITRDNHFKNIGINIEIC